MLSAEFAPVRVREHRVARDGVEPGIVAGVMMSFLPIVLIAVEPFGTREQVWDCFASALICEILHFPRLGREGREQYAASSAFAVDGFDRSCTESSTPSNGVPVYPAAPRAAMSGLDSTAFSTRDWAVAARIFSRQRA